jgi:hypothetical protein
VSRLVSTSKESIPEPVKDFVRSVQSHARPILDRSLDVFDGAARKRDMIPPPLSDLCRERGLQVHRTGVSGAL